MDFGDAIRALRAGSRVTRAGWNGKSMWLTLIVETTAIATPTTNVDLQKETWRVLPWIGMKTAQDDFVPWLASQTDMLAVDWLIVG